MAFQIVWTLPAQEELNVLYTYLEEHWTEREIVRFSENLEEKLNLIAWNPLIFAAVPERVNIHRCVVTKQNTLYYRIDYHSQRVIIESMFDTRQNPDKLNI